MEAGGELGRMTLLLTLAFLAQPECRVGHVRARLLVEAAQEASARHRLPRGLLLAVVLVESGGRNVVARGRGKGKLGCDVGPAQIHVPRCVKSRVRWLLRPARNVLVGAQILARSRRKCSRYPWWYGCRGGLYGRYNPGSASWGPEVRRVWSNLLKSCEVGRGTS